MIKQSVDNILPKKTTLHGMYRGVIEDNVDPEKLGRCKIRIWGVHDELKDEDESEGIPTEKLPWSEPCLGLIEGSISGAGAFSVPLQGSHVFLFFEGGNWEAPRYFATAPALPVDKPDPKMGFNDPDGNYPREDRLNEPDWHRLARGRTDGTIVPHKNSQKDTDVEKALTEPRETWDEPDSAYAAEYPKNIVLATHRGITVEFDNTEGQERLHIYHPSNTYLEIDNVGNVVFTNANDRFEITNGDRYKHVKGKNQEKGNEFEKIDVDKSTYIGADQLVEVGNTVTRDIGTDLREHVGNNWNIKVDGSITIEAGINITLKAPTINVEASESITEKAPVIDMNP